MDEVVQEDCVTGIESVLAGSQRGVFKEAGWESQAGKGRLKQLAPLGDPWDRWLWGRDEEGRHGGGVLQAPGQRETRKGNRLQTSSNASRSPSLGHCSPTHSSVLATRTEEARRGAHRTALPATTQL